MRQLAGSPRFAGSASETAARKWCASFLRDAGFSVREEPFRYSQFPARWAPAVISIILALAGWLAGYAAVVTHEPAVAVRNLTVASAICVLAGRYLSRWGVLNFPLWRSDSTNMVATRGSRTPSVWLVAHIDSKSQTIPMLVRITSVALFVFSLLVLQVAGLAMAFTDNSDLQQTLAYFAHGASIVLVPSALPLALCFIGNRSNGALDNATGVAAVLLAARNSSSRSFGVIITSAEELGLAGAYAYTRAHPETAVAINCDTVDDTGDFLLMRSKPPSESLTTAVLQAAARCGIRKARFEPMLLGVLADNVAFSSAGWDSFTISKGNLRTLSRVHTSGDRADSISGTGIAQAALLIDAIVEELS